MATTRRLQVHRFAALVFAAACLVAIPVAFITWLQGSSSAGGASMWNGLVVEGTELETYADVGQMTRAADAVVRGQVTAIVPGRVFGVPGVDELHYAEATVRIAEVLAGAVDGSDEITLEIPLFTGVEYLQTMQAAVPWNESIYFLRNKGESARRAGLSQEVQRFEARYYRLVVMAGFVVNERGTAGVVANDAGAMETLRGMAFTDVKANVKRSRSD